MAARKTATQYIDLFEQRYLCCSPCCRSAIICKSYWVGRISRPLHPRRTRGYLMTPVQAGLVITGVILFVCVAVQSAIRMERKNLAQREIQRAKWLARTNYGQSLQSRRGIGENEDGLKSKSATQH